MTSAPAASNLKQLLSIRNACPELRWGNLSNLSGGAGVLRFERVFDGKCVQAIFNFSRETVEVPETEIEQTIVWTGEGDLADEFKGELHPFSGALYYASAPHV